MSSGFMHVVAYVRISFLFKAEYSFVICTYYILFIHSFLDGHLSCSHLSPIANAAATAAAKSLQSCPTLCDPIDSSPPGSLVPGILQARTLEWVAISFSNAQK